MAPRSCPRTRTWPPPAFNRPAAIFKISVLLVPVSPTSTLASRGATLKLTPRRISPSSKPIRTSSNEMTGSVVLAFIPGWGAASLSDAYVYYRWKGRLAAASDCENVRYGRRSFPTAAAKRQATTSNTGRIKRLKDAAGKKQGQLGQEEIRSQNNHRRHHDGLRRGAAHALRSSTDGKTLIASDGGENKGEY